MTGPEIVRGRASDLHLARLSPLGWGMYVTRGRFRPYRHTRLWNRAALDAILGELRLLLESPPRHGKTDLMRFVAGWYFGTFKTRNVMYAAHTQKLTDRFGAMIRTDIRECGEEVFGVTISDETRAKADFAVEGPEGERAEFLGVGTGGSPHGRGAALLLTDDLVPHSEAARSDVQMEAIESFFRIDLLSRREPGFTHIGIQTRWSERDPHGICHDLYPDLYRTLRLPAIAEDDEPDYPFGMGRRKGEALWPERHPIDEIVQQQVGMPPSAFSAIYQQRPAPEEGNIWKTGWWDDHRYVVREGRLHLGSYSVPTDALMRYVVVDMAFSEKKTADYTVVGVFGVTPRNPRDIVLLDWSRSRIESPDLWPLVRRMMRRWSCRQVWAERDGTQIGKIQEARRLGIPVRTISKSAGDADLRTASDKVAVAWDAAPIASAGRVWFPLGAAWAPDLEHELAYFGPGCAHDDQADVFAWGLLIGDRVGPPISGSPIRRDRDTTDHEPYRLGSQLRRPSTL